VHILERQWGNSKACPIYWSSSGDSSGLSVLDMAAFWTCHLRLHSRRAAPAPSYLRQAVSGGGATRSASSPLRALHANTCCSLKSTQRLLGADAFEWCRNDERELWRSFMEDFNTCTLPGRKYYDLSVHARKLGAAAAACGARDDDAHTFVDDERLRRAELMEQHRRAQDQSARDTMAKMMLTSEHLSELKQREMIRMQAQEAYKTGDMVKAQKLMKKLNPDEEDLRDLEHYNN
jgi:hypothetical protein